MSRLAILGFLLSVTGQQISTTNKSCSADPLYYKMPCGEKTYIFNTFSRVNWFNANIFCEEKNMRLVSIESLEEHNFIIRKADEIGLKDARWWIGGNDFGNEGVFYWGFRQRKKYTNWFKGEPNNSHKNEHCTEIFPRNGQYQWNDHICAEEKFFICEFATNLQ